MRQLILNASAVRAAGGHVTIVSQGAGRYFSVNQGAILAAENIEFVVGHHSTVHRMHGKTERGAIRL